MTINDYFSELKTKDIICWGSGKHFRNVTLPFLQKSGLLENLKGFVNPSGGSEVVVCGCKYPVFSRDELCDMDAAQTAILITVAGYDEILSQLQADSRWSNFEAVPSIFLESLYEDLQLLSVPKPPLHYRKHDKPVIPKVIHAIWFSGEPLPELYQRCLESWRKNAPDFEIKIWNLKTYQPGKCLFYEQAIEHRNWAFASDYARADLLRRYGGIYMDLDVEMLRPIDDLLYNDAYMSFESLGRIECGSGMGARAGHPLMNEICESYEQRPYLKPDGTWDNSTCPVRYTQVIECHGLVKNGGFQFVDDVTIYPFEVLTGKSFDTGIIYRTEHSYTVHHHNGSWVPDSAHRAMAQRYAKIQEFLDQF
ncbi:MAG: hypothetical protein K6A05_01225 [Lachnospiraceae bacterium]|nr:hypothetical protein [Lachnospiraceae bacterium]